MPTDRRAVLRAWLSARWSGWSLRTPADVARRQARLWRAMAPVVARTPAISNLAGRPLADFPIMTPDVLRERFDAWSTLGLKRPETEAAALAVETLNAS